MPLWIFFGLYPLMIIGLALTFLAPAPLIVSLASNAFDPWVAFVPVAFASFAWFFFWGLYPRKGGNFNSQCEPGGGVTCFDSASDVSRAIRWTVDNANRFNIDTKRIYLCGYSAGAHLVALVGSRSSFLDSVGLSLQSVAGFACISSPFSVRIMLEELPFHVQFYVWYTALRSAFGVDEKKWLESDPIVQIRKSSSGTSQRSTAKWLLTVGAKEYRMFHVQMERFAEALRAEKFSVKTLIVAGRKHAGMITAFGTSPDEAVTSFIMSGLEIPRRDARKRSSSDSAASKTAYASEIALAEIH
eukprot:g124.t1